ncbi:hypothetical protein, partial [Actinotalea sp.]|uniref:hypothetical protein n=1 Tax=Actinotalea sp. TaxID=1872145 RepID=UPI00356968BC
MADEWSPPTEDSSTDYRAPQQGFEALLSRLRRLAARVAALEGSAPLRQAGVTVKSLGLWVDRALHVSGDFTSAGSADITGATHIGGATDIDGTLNVDANTTIGGTLGVTGNTTLGAPTTISGALTVTGGTTITGSTSIGG